MNELAYQCAVRSQWPAHRFDNGRSCDAATIDYGDHIARCTTCGMRWSLGQSGWVPIGRATTTTIRGGMFA